MRRLASLIAFVVFAQGCGIKGPLYIETAEQKRKADERRERREAAVRQREAPGSVPASPAGTIRTPAPSGADDSAAVPAASLEATLPDEAFGPSSPPPQ